MDRMLNLCVIKELNLTKSTFFASRIKGAKVDCKIELHKNRCKRCTRAINSAGSRSLLSRHILQARVKSLTP